MPYRNRVTPDGDLVRTEARGTFMGNRGCLHDVRGEIVRAHAGRRWIICVLEWRGRRRRVMQPGLYTELFFLDEATALAAGHRPCAECRRERFDAFRRSWADAHGGARPSAVEMDQRLHRERSPAGRGSARERPLAGLPVGCMVRPPGDDAAYLVAEDGLLRWTPFGYQRPPDPGRRGTVEVITPASTLAALEAGYRPVLHRTAMRG